MTTRILCTLILALLLSNIGSAQGHGFGLGVMIGNPTGASCKGWVTPSGAVQLGIGWPSLSQSGSTVVSLEYLWHAHIFRSHQQLPIFYGLGGILGVSNVSNTSGLRGVLGIAWLPRGSSLDVFLQIAPTLYFQPASKFDFDWGLGMRYFF